MLVFRVETHPNFTWFTQCITFNTFPSDVHKVSYTLFGMVVMYWVPLIVIFYTYTSIFVEICRRSQERNEGTMNHNLSPYTIRKKVTKFVLMSCYCYFSLYSNLLHRVYYLIIIQTEIDKLKWALFSDKLRRSSSGFLSRARVRTLKMTITIIAVFIICWSPYYVMCVW